MLSKVASACAVVYMGASTAEAQRGGKNRGYQAPQQSYGYQAPQQSYGYQAPQQNYGYQAPQQSYGYPWVRRSTYRPRDVEAYNVVPVDNYYQYAEKADETIIASCEFDFLGYSHSSGRVELKQIPGDLTSIIGEFENVNPGLHAFKIHEFGDLEYGCDSTGDVFNPFGAYRGHAHLDIHNRRVGDLEDCQARWDLGAEYKVRDALVTLSGPNSVIGRSMVIYEREDDHDQTEHPGTKTREARYREGEGARIACCVIGLAKGEKPKYH
jgi:Cu-Zn family superoxide dismutase